MGRVWSRAHGRRPKDGSTGGESGKRTGDLCPRAGRDDESGEPMTEPVTVPGSSLEGADGALSVPSNASVDDVVATVRAWVASAVPAAWVEAGRRGGPAAVREVRTRAEYEAWYPTFGRSGLVAPTWPRAYGGLDLSREAARMVELELSPFNLGRLNPLGINLAAPALFAHGTEEQR